MMKLSRAPLEKCYPTPSILLAETKETTAGTILRVDLEGPGPDPDPDPDQGLGQDLAANLAHRECQVDVIEGQKWTQRPAGSADEEAYV